ncbi:hypothetical protein OIE66_17230 [Nonomuraea sp. NBC_01738]|uniref:hypothetical protein n=1 Tax=Nonomuraea sp. NBC_01738 TaxID=2976003 RepID=UPI002E137CF4|nr:hypothetical protein OIE66_17230 [Nonomuraea sp. NBC_01738]
MTYQHFLPEQTYVPPPAPEQTIEEPKRGSVLEVVEKIGSVAVPVAVSLYAMLYIGIQDVYATFGITPEQAGLDQATIFARLISTLVQIFLLAVPAVGVLVGLGWLVNLITRGSAGRLVGKIRENTWIAAGIGALLSGLGYWVYLYVHDGFYGESPDLSVGGAGVQALVIAAVGLLIPYRVMRRKGAMRAGMKILTGSLVGVGLGFLVVVGMIMGAVDIRANGVGNEFLDLVGFKNQWATVHDGDDKAVLKDDDRALLLGEMEGAYVLYNCGTMETIRRPIEATLLGQIEIDPDFSQDGTVEVEPCGYAAEDGE